jgi:SSS family solute:Na+ symporter
MLAVGFILARRQTSRSEFYVSSRRLNSGVLFATVFATVVGANTFMGFSGQVYSGGFSQMWFLTAAGGAYFVLFFIVGKIRRMAQKFEVYTLPDMMEVRYSNPVALLTTLFSFVGLVGGAGGSILGIGVILHTTLGISTNLAIIITAAVTIIYTAFGGLSAVAWTDWIQSLIMVSGIVLVIIFGAQLLTPHAGFGGSFVSVGSSLKHALGAGSVSIFQGITIVLVFGWWLTFLPLNTIAQTQIQRVYAAKSERVMRNVSLMMIVFVALFLSFCLALVGVMGRALIPHISNPEAVFPQLALHVINPWIGIIIVTGILGAAMSTTDSNLLGASINVSRDIYERYEKMRNRPIRERTGLRLSQWAIVVIGVASTVAALTAPSIIDLLVVTQQIFGGATFVPVVAGMAWRRTNGKGALAGLIVGGAVTIASEIMGSSIAVIYGFGASLIALIIVTLVTPAVPSKSDAFGKGAVEKRDYPVFISICVFFVIFMLALSKLSLWPIILAVSLAGMVCAIILMVAYAVPRRRRTSDSKEFNDVNN